MTNQIIDNGADEQFASVILWQYDKATILCAFVNALKLFFNSTTKSIWNTMIPELNADDASSFGLSILGTLIGCPRPNGISDSLYRKIVKAWFTLMMSNYTVYDINLYLKTIFGERAISVNDNGALEDDDSDYAPMTINWTVDDSGMSNEEKSLIDDYPELVYRYPVGVFNGGVMEHTIFALKGQKHVASTDPYTGGLDESNFLYGGDESKYIPESERIVAS